MPDVTGPALDQPRVEVDRAGSTRRSVLVLQRGEALGDAIIHIPAYRALRSALPEHRIVCVYEFETVFSSTLAAVRNLFVDEIVTGLREKSLFHVGAVARTMGNVDLVLDFRGNPNVAASYLACFGATSSYLANTPGFSVRKNIAGSFERRPQANVRRFHRMVELATGLSLPFETRLPEDPKAKAQAAAMLPPGRRYIGIAPGLTDSNKYWSRANHEALVRHLREMDLCPVYLLGPDRSETEQREWLSKSAPEAIFLDLEAAGGDRTHLAWLFHAAAPRLSACVAVEGGIGHLVATQGVALLTLEGPTNATRWRPVTPRWRLVRASDFGSNKMENISASAVATVIAEMMDDLQKPAGSAHKWIDRL